jgi:hypothetical protein
MFSKKVKIPIDRALHEKLTRIAEVGGYSSVDEFIVHILEKEAGRLDSAQDDSEVEKQLRGLGYIE